MLPGHMLNSSLMGRSLSLTQDAIPSLCSLPSSLRVKEDGLRKMCLISFQRRPIPINEVLYSTRLFCNSFVLATCKLSQQFLLG